MALNERELQVLEAVIETYVRTAEPAGSRTISRLSGLGLSPASIRKLTQRMADAFAEGIAAHPEDWHMLQRLWLTDLERTAA